MLFSPAAGIAPRGPARPGPLLGSPPGLVRPVGLPPSPGLDFLPLGGRSSGKVLFTGENLKNIWIMPVFNVSFP